jgi:hypothetical protein
MDNDVFVKKNIQHIYLKVLLLQKNYSILHLIPVFIIVNGVIY